MVAPNATGVCHAGCYQGVPADCHRLISRLTSSYLCRVLGEVNLVNGSPTNAPRTQERLEDQIAWYDRKSSWNQRWFKAFKVVQIIAGALIAFFAPLREGALRYVTGILGVVVVILESLQGLYQFQHYWIQYRTTSEGLKREKYLWLAKAGPYASAERPDALLAERVEALLSQEHAGWVALQEQPASAGPSGSIRTGSGTAVVLGPQEQPSGKGTS